MSNSRPIASSSHWGGNSNFAAGIVAAAIEDWIRRFCKLVPPIVQPPGCYQQLLQKVFQKNTRLRQLLQSRSPQQKPQRVSNSSTRCLTFNTKWEPPSYLLKGAATSKAPSDTWQLLQLRTPAHCTTPTALPHNSHTSDFASGLWQGAPNRPFPKTL
jgi:hypothetical protein